MSLGPPTFVVVFILCYFFRLLFNPFVQWWRKGPIAPQIHRFLWSNAPLHYKISMMACECCCEGDRIRILSAPFLFCRYVLVLCVLCFSEVAIARWR